MTTAPSFDPGEHLITFKGKSYLEVKYRLLWLRIEHPEAHIETHLHHLEQGSAVFQAKVSIPDLGSATGWGSEEASDFPDFVEKAETKALGRALAALGYGTQFTEDFTFEKDGETRLVDTPVQRPPRPPVRPQQGPVRVTGGDTASPAQVNAIYAIGRKEHGWGDEGLEEVCQERYKKFPSALTKREASEFIDMLKGGKTSQ